MLINWFVTAYHTIFSINKRKYQVFPFTIHRNFVKYCCELYTCWTCLPSIKPGIRPQNLALLKLPLKNSHPEMHSNNIYVVTLPTPDVDIDPRDPSWVGAWWIGFIIIAVIMLIWTFPVLLFPPRLPGQTGGVKDTNVKELAKGNVPCTSCLSCQKSHYSVHIRVNFYYFFRF